MDKLEPELPWLAESAFADYSTSRSLDELVRRELKEHRPKEDGRLLIMQDVLVFENAVREFFEARNGNTYYVFMAHWPDLGAMQLSSAQLAKQAVQLLFFDGDDIYGCDQDRQEVVSFDMTTDAATAASLELFSFATSEDRCRFHASDAL